jgi:hypothetical protein
MQRLTAHIRAPVAAAYASLLTADDVDEVDDAVGVLLLVTGTE